jgi:hypothetical protein
MGNPSDPANWRASITVGGSPGSDGLPGPIVTSKQFHYQTGHSFTFTFDLDIDVASLQSSDVSVQPVSGGSPVNPTSVTYDAPTRTATFSFTTALPDGNYTATLLIASVSSTTGKTLGSNSTIDFFVLAGDADHDRDIDVNDLGILATNWQQSPRQFSQGDFDYNGTVDVNDLGILATKWQQSLSPPSAPASRGAPSSVRAKRMIDQLTL